MLSTLCFPKSMADVEKKVELMRRIVEQKDSDSKDLDDSTLKRFLRARDLDVDRASNFLLKHLSWRRENIPKGFISESEIQNEIAQKKIFSQGFDKNGRPIAVLFGCRHNPSNRDLNEFKRFAAYILEKLCSRMQGKEEKFTIIADLKGWGYSNCDIRAYIAALDILQNNYPERLGKLLLLHVPYLFMKAWKIICPFIDKNTKSKIIFVEDKNKMTTLLEDIDESQLPEQYGGRLKLVPIEES
ncbi:phosphatidylinositol transfer protein 3-like isoform X1 [Dendrobium catenatum]|uniref:phosphatidylinositol transfer protein 3-like isoform X1 n=1 Tax=Dendrobium catenatum TaxID=906689 RepID=UPI0009F6965A|nr:phosphatidylinositol transfer protein 3-like isoform X1 [Dendrobium catenatum]